MMNDKNTQWKNNGEGNNLDQARHEGNWGGPHNLSGNKTRNGHYRKYRENTEAIVTKQERRDVERRLRALLQRYDGLVSYSSQTRYWLTDFNASDGVMLVRLNNRGEVEIDMCLDPRYFSAASQSINRANTRLYAKRSDFGNLLHSLQLKSLLLEADYMNINQAKEVREWVGRDCNLLDIQGHELRAVKTTREIQRIQRACDISLEAFRWVRVHVLYPGVSEQEVARALSQRMYQLGADGPAFDPIIAFGPNTAHPHHRSGERRLLAGDIVTMDFGAKYRNYCSDITRTFLAPGVSRLSREDSDKLRAIYSAVAKSAKEGREAVRVGLGTQEVDSVCNQVIIDSGLGEYLAHSTGHGVGLDIHEAPRVSRTSVETLTVGHVITIEPGAYVPNIGGARVEDTVAIQEDRAVILSRPYLYNRGNYQAEFDYFDLNTLVQDIKSGRVESPARVYKNRDLLTLLKTYEEASRAEWAEENIMHRMNNEPVVHEIPEDVVRHVPEIMTPDKIAQRFSIITSPFSDRSRQPQPPRMSPSIEREHSGLDSISANIDMQRRRPGRPRKGERVVAQNGTLHDIDYIDNGTTPRRGPGRPRKSAARTDSRDVGSEVEPHVRRPGRPRKVKIEGYQDVESPRRGPGRPRKSANTVNSEESAVRRKRGRPPKNDVRR